MTTEVEKTDNSAAAGSDQPRAARENRMQSLLLALVLAVLALVVSAYVWFGLDSGPARQEVQPAPALTAGQETAMADMRAETDRTSRELTSLQAELAAIRAELAAVSRQARQSNFDWLLAEVEYLFIIASQRLALDQDVAVALAALQAADDRLRNYDDPRLLPTRKQLTADINTLQAVARVDIPGLALYLIDIASRVNGLPLKPLPEDTPAAMDAAAAQAAPAAEPSFWRRLGNAVMDTLKDLVRVHHDTAGVPAILLPEQRQYIYQSLNLQLETATRAVLNKDTRNFQAALVIVMNNLRENFDTRDPVIDGIIESLSRMSSVELQPPLPSIDSSLETLRALIRATTDGDAPTSDGQGAAPP
jgi:uncharacterized protein HemX